MNEFFNDDIDNEVKLSYSDEDIDNALDATVRGWSERDDIDSIRLERQIDVLKRIANGLKKGTKRFIIDAPTGFGKTILGFMISDMQSILRKDNRISYIVSSNKFLQDQYESDIEHFKLHTFQSLKGQGNYKCNTNGEFFGKRECIKTPLSKLADNKKYSKCMESCKYVQARIKAINSHCAVFNYSYFLTTMNKVYKLLGEKAPFQPRPLAIFDECHVIENVVQDMFRVVVNNDLMCRNIVSNHEWAKIIYSHSVVHGALITSEDDAAMQTLLKECEKICKELIFISKIKEQTNDDYLKIYTSLTKYQANLGTILSMFSKVINKKFPKDQEEYNKDQKKFFDCVIYISELYQTLNSALHIFKDDVSKMVITYEETEDKDPTFILRYLDSAKLVQKYIIEYTDIAVFMSATVGNIDSYAIANGIEDYEGIKVESDFDYSKSPILLVTPQLKMNFAEREKNTPIMLKRIEDIMTIHKDHSGIIHSGTYSFLDKMRDYFMFTELGDRILFCDSAESKKLNMEMVKEHPDRHFVLAGPSLLEGVDLKDDLARFCIFAKVPYASLGDKLVKRKIDFYPNWYTNTTMCHFLQGIGRVVRHKNDWGRIYLIDGGFQTFFERYGYDKLPPIMQGRLESVNAEQEYMTPDEQMKKFFAEQENGGISIPKNDVESIEPKVDEYDFSAFDDDTEEDLPF